MLVEALAHGGSWRGTAEEAATAAGLPTDVVDERLAVRQPIVQAELEARALGNRLEREPPHLALPDQHGRPVGAQRAGRQGCRPQVLGHLVRALSRGVPALRRAAGEVRRR